MKRLLFLSLVIQVIAGLPLKAMNSNEGGNLLLDNGRVRRVINIADGHVITQSYKINTSDVDYLRSPSCDFSFSINDIKYSGRNDWSDISSRDTTASNGGRGLIISFYDKAKTFKVEISYLTYPDLPLIRKTLDITNLSKDEFKVEAVCVEDLALSFDCTNSYTFRQYARSRAFGPYVGNWDDPLIVVQDILRDRGMAVGNEMIGVLKRTSVFEDGVSIKAGVTFPDQAYPFRRWLKKDETWHSAAVFTAPYDKQLEISNVINTTVQDYVRKYMGTRIEQIEHKPMFVYNTWNPFRTNINEKLIYDLAEAAAECGVEEFVIDDGWEILADADGKFGRGDWVVDPKKFPNGLKPVFDHIKSLGMKPGLWISLATAEQASLPFRQHPEWFVVGPDGKTVSLHAMHAGDRTACLDTDWYDYIRDVILKLVKEYGLAYAKLDLAILTSAYVYSDPWSGCYATNHRHKDREESFALIYERCMQLFDELHREAPDLFIDCTYETAGKLQLMDYGFAKHAEGNWLTNVYQANLTGDRRVRAFGWGHTPALPATSLVIGNLKMDSPCHIHGYKSLTGSLPIMLGDPRNLSKEERAEYKAWSGWIKSLESRHSIMSFRQDLPGFGEPMDGSWDGFCRINTDTHSGGLIGVFREGAAESRRTVSVPYLLPDHLYAIKKGPDGEIEKIATGDQLAKEGFAVAFDSLYDGELYEVIMLD